MVNWFVQTVQIFAHFSIQTIRTLNFMFNSALLFICPVQGSEVALAFVNEVSQHQVTFFQFL